MYFHILGGSFRPLLEDEQRFPDSSFSASASSEGHNASDARISSGSSWCAPVSDAKHYLQVDLGRLYDLDFFVTYGDSSSQKWVTTYNLEYTVDLLNWKTLNRVRKNILAANNKNMIACTSLFNYYCDISLFFTLLVCRYFKETKMLTIMQPGDLFQFEQEPYDSFH
jgi:hypothetical protein